VGKTKRLKTKHLFNLVHPHTRGEDYIGKKEVLFLPGSPPHTWGRLYRKKGSAFSSWFTPTHVGKTYSENFSSEKSMVHPHTRGEDVISEMTAVEKDGSPPHTWGRL